MAEGVRLLGASMSLTAFGVAVAALRRSIRFRRIVEPKGSHVFEYRHFTQRRKLAEGVRFELTRSVSPCRFSRPVP